MKRTYVNKRAQIERLEREINRLEMDVERLSAITQNARADALTAEERGYRHAIVLHRQLRKILDTPFRIEYRDFMKPGGFLGVGTQFESPPRYIPGMKEVSGSFPILEFVHEYWKDLAGPAERKTYLFTVDPIHRVVFFCVKGDS